MKTADMDDRLKVLLVLLHAQFFLALPIPDAPLYYNITCLNIYLPAVNQQAYQHPYRCWNY